MSNSDSFIDEVTEELRRDRLYGYLKRYGWIAALAVLLLVGGAAWFEWQGARERAAAEARGDALLDALETAEASDRAAALAAVDAQGGVAGVAGLLEAAELQEAGEPLAAAERLDAVATDAAVPQLYRDVASFKAALLRAGEVPEDELRLTLEPLAEPGAPFRLLAEEQIALSHLRAGETETALDVLRTIREDAEVSEGLRDRASGLMVALGEDPDAEPAAE